MICEKHGSTSVLCKFCDAELIREQERIELDVRANVLLGYADAFYRYGKVYTGDLDIAAKELPRFTLDDGAAFRICADYGIRTFSSDTYCEASFNFTSEKYEQVTEMTHKHEDRYTATRVAVVRALIKKLEGSKS